MEKIQITFGKDKTAVIKGVAIIFMIILHVLGGCDWYEPCYDVPINHDETFIHLMHSFQICVGIFVFMIGYGYAFSKQKDFAYSVKHIKQLLLVFWTIVLLFALPFGHQSVKGAEHFIQNLFGVDETITWVSWFIYLYIWAMIVMPFIGHLIDRNPYAYSILCAFLSYLSLVVIHYFNPQFGLNPYLKSLFVCLNWTPTIILGYLFARKGIFQKISLPKHWSVAVGSIVMVALVLYAKSIFEGIKVLNADIIYAPIIITCILILFSQFKLKWISKVLIELGDKSVYMWFIHALFFTAATRPTYQQYVMISDNLFIVCIWTIVLSYVISIPLKKIIEF
ncbi:acyltransferase family protein [Bacteroides sp.]